MVTFVLSDDIKQANILINCKLTLDTGEGCVELRARMGGRR